MKFSAVFLAATLVPAVLASFVPQVVQDNLDQVRFGVEEALSDDACPDFLVRCIKDGDITNPVGDIGNKGMKRKGLKCVQAHPKLNTAECNAKYPLDCSTKCETQASPI
ncbi:uncharacterized protein JCM6883_005678 [Sporobolomyces salmoneus]|uniref:uncharacterized protein n=1 Tax=Sporobolomyces salmoneus TaxID=183962 RepID=UPI00316F1B9D